MNRFQLSPMSHRPHSNPRLEFVERPGAMKWKDAKLFRSWLVYDSDVETERKPGRLNWDFVVGVATMVIVSVGAWACVAWLARHFLR
jgi:hypothetical protein